MGKNIPTLRATRDQLAEQARRAQAYRDRHRARIAAGDLRGADTRPLCNALPTLIASGDGAAILDELARRNASHDKANSKGAAKLPQWVQPEAEHVPRERYLAWARPATQLISGRESAL
ncbi:MAG: hypothetical protein H0W40_03740 [Methylibium sp.]|uniref:hypothetical protein n=1 Tax=Methylibium sp. TaxID=2067992 RepID=UPI0017B18F78|nr:hypothetical protein [Methylibium sp.]MBA3596473.1 hypothetical protein [Methylibium sp.]